MGYYVSHMIGIRTGGVFSGSTDIQDVKRRIKTVITAMRDSGENPDIPDDPTDIMSGELTAHKGSYVVLAGVFNGWDFKSAGEFARWLSKEFGTDVMHMCWDEQTDEIRCQVWFNGKPLPEAIEHPAERILRRIG